MRARLMLAGTAAVIAVNTPHQITPIVSTRRGPKRSARRPPRVWKRASDMKKAVVGVAVFVLLASIPGLGQLGLFSKEKRIEFTPEWHGERFADGRPKVADGVLARLKEVTADEAWDILQDSGYRNQFEPGWKVIYPGDRLVGRVVTAVFTPRRPDVDSIIQANGKKEQRLGSETSGEIDIMQPGDVLVVDLFVKISYVTFAGVKLSTA